MGRPRADALSTGSAPAPAEPVVNLLTIPEKRHRAIAEIEQDLADAKQLFREQEAENRDYHARRGRALAYFERCQQVWKQGHPGEPFDGSVFVPPPHIPPPDSPVGRAFHKQHYVIGRLEAEFEAAKAAEVGQ